MPVVDGMQRSSLVTDIICSAAISRCGGCCRYFQRSQETRWLLRDDYRPVFIHRLNIPKARHHQNIETQAVKHQKCTAATLFIELFKTQPIKTTVFQSSYVLISWKISISYIPYC